VIDSIFNEWEHYSSVMGSQVLRKGNCIISVNRNSQISCDFSNSVVCLGEPTLNINDLRVYFNVGRFQSYYIITNTDRYNSCTPYKRTASLMVLDYETWANNLQHSSILVFDNKVKFLKLSISDVEDFADVVFSAFKYDRRFKEDSVKLYKNGVLSSYVTLYGLKLDNTLVSCLLVHRDENSQIYGIELVSTKEGYRNKGFSKTLLHLTFRVIFNSKNSKIWLFAIENGIAERIYSSLGFKKVAKILISSNG